MISIPITKTTSWQLNLNEQWVVTGPVASGKTWLARQLVTRYPDQVALVTFDQQTPVEGADWQAARYHASLDYSEALKTVEEALSYDAVNDINPFEVRPKETRKRAAFKKLKAHIIQCLALEPLLEETTIQLSNGEQRRLLLACAILRQTPIVVLDDPFAGLDPAMQELLRNVLQTLVDEGRTLVLMVRNEDEIPPCITHKLTLAPYQLVSQGPCKIAPVKAETIVVKKNPPSLATPEVLAVRDLSIQIGARTLFNGLNWSVHAGERWLIIGPNGSGKTTLLSLITGDNPMTYACDIEIFGQHYGPGIPLWSIRSRIATVSPEAQACVNLSLTVEQTILSGLFDKEGQRKRPTPSQRKEATEWMKALGLYEHAHDLLATLSAGLIRLILVARALVAKPDILLLDELCMNLEVAERNLLLKLLDRLLAAAPQLTVLYIAHRQDHIPANFLWTLRLGN